MTIDPPELLAARVGAALFALASWQALRPVVVAPGERVAAPPAALWFMLGAAVLTMAVAIAQRWLRLGHGPFLSMYEVLTSSLFSLGLIYGIACRRIALLRASAPVVLPLLALMAAWLLATNPADTHLPPTYGTPVLWFHVTLGKLFLGCALGALGLAGIVLLRCSARGARSFAALPDDEMLDRQAWRLMLVALVFESLMLIAGAVWAQDAWGRYWDWDPLETWAFVTWLLLTAAVHVRRTWPIGPRAGAWTIVVVFVVAFLTFFGVPFVTTVPHQGAV